jgi:hypothetical protein
MEFLNGSFRFVSKNLSHCQVPLKIAKKYNFLVLLVANTRESPKTQVFVWFSVHIFPFYKMLFMNILDF